MWTTNVGTAAITARLDPPAPRPPVAVKAAAPEKRGRAKGKFFRGVASWYGSVWNGRPTASGEIFQETAMTACHASLPFGTLVRVINLRNHRSVVVRINDRGLEGTGRLIDLSSAAAEQIGMLHAGLAPVRLEVIGATAVHG